MKTQFLRYPKYRALYVKAFDRMVERRKEREMPTTWENGEDVMSWWYGES